MSFNNVGAATECKPENLTIGIERYCPKNNKDGAELLAELQAGDLVTDETDLTYGSDGRRHVDDLAGAINSIRATSWTPLAEALYSALGYYTQNQVFCLDKDSDGNCLEDDKFCLAYDSSTGKCIAANPIEDPVQAWCQDNHILLITEGESTADINELVTTFSPTGAEDYVNSRPAACECNPDNTDAAGVCNTDSWTGDGDTVDAQCSDSIFASTYLDDMTWWGQYIYPLYRERCVADVDDRLTEKKAISTHLVTTGALTADAAGGECDPATLMTNAAANGGTVDYRPGESPEQLEENLMAVLDDILSRASAGSAASVISSSRSGSGAVYQAVFWPEYPYKDSDGDTRQISWVGDVHSLFMTAEGMMYEDTDRNGKMTGADRRVIFYFSEHVNKTRGCYAIDTYITTGACPGDDQDVCGAGDQCVEIGDINYLWSVNEQLEDMDVLTDRKVYTWNDANNDGIVDSTEWFRLNTSVNWDTLNAATDSTGRGPVTRDFLTEDDWSSFAADDGSDHENDALNALVEWILGADQPNTESADDNGNGRLDKELRSRDYRRNGSSYTWRLGDVIHSTPTVVARPAESYHYIYRDPTYKDFADKWAKRRSVIYFGGNDGMLHAINGGFYFENGNQFCCTDELNSDGTCAVAPKAGTDHLGNTIAGVCDGAPNLGEELWAYIPYNLQPHLKCLPDKLYTHKYFVDQKPRIFDVQIFVEEEACRTGGASDPGCIHPGGWGTILVGSMRFGGAPIAAETFDDDSGEDGIYDRREFSSSFFILDITNPEADLTNPLLLGEITRTAGTEYVDLNYTTGVPSMVIMRDGGAYDVRSKWYLVMGNGPSALDGSNTDQGKIALLPLEWLNGSLTWKNGRPVAVDILGRKSIRIPNTEPASGNEGGRFLVPKGGDSGTDPSYISDIIAIDYNIDITAPDDLGARYRTDAIYFGTVDGSNFAEYEDPDAPDNQFYWNGGGRIFRLVTKKLDATGEEVASEPSEWPGMWKDGNPLRLLLDVKRPVIAGPSIGYDNHNYWIYAGTGRFFDPYDKTDDGWCVGTGGANDPTDPNCWCADGDATCRTSRSLNRFFGIKEPVADYRSTLFNDGFTEWNSTDYTSWTIDCDDALFTWETINWDANTQENSDLSQTVNTALAIDPTSERPGQRGLMQSDNILVSGTGALGCYHCTTNVLGGRSCTALSETDCFPGGNTGPIFDTGAGQYTFAHLQNYIAGTGCQTVDGQDISTGLDGWYYEFHDPRERNLGTSALLGGLLTFTSYQPYNDPCKAEGESFLYGLHYQTGTAPQETVFGSFDEDGTIHSDETGSFVMEKLSLGRGLSTTPSIHSGSSDGYEAKAFIQTSTGEIIEVEQKNLPLGNTKSGRQGWTDRCGN
jgi:type IV pilus assembly protein PilY1